MLGVALLGALALCVPRGGPMQPAGTPPVDPPAIGAVAHAAMRPTVSARQEPERPFTPEESPAAPSADDGVSVVVCDAITLPFRDLEIAAEIGGVIGAVDVEEGDRVTRGQVLVRFAAGVVEARRRWQQAQTEAAEVQLKAEQTNCEVITAEYERSADLFAQKVIPEVECVKARLDRDLAEWRVRAAEATLTASEAANILEDERLAQTIVRAPIDGRILRIAKRPGEAVEIHNPMLQMVCLDPLYVVANAPIETFGRIHPGMTARLSIPYLERELECEVVVVDRVANVGSETYRVKLTLPNPDGSVAAGARGPLRFELSE